MEHLLKQVGLDFEEFRYICHSYHHSDRRNYLIGREDNNAYQSNDKLLELKNKSVAYLRKHPNDIPVSNILKRVEVILCLRESGPDERVRIMATEAWNEIKNQMSGTIVTSNCRYLYLHFRNSDFIQMK